MSIVRLRKPSAETVDRLLCIWESAVMATHTFLSAADVADIKPEVRRCLQDFEHLYGYYDENHALQGFIGTEGHAIEMLFVAAERIGQGIGKQLLRYAITHRQAKYVDVNEQNVQGADFYRHMGFRVVGRSALDGQGRPFPLLHLELDCRVQP